MLLLCCPSLADKQDKLRQAKYVKALTQNELWPELEKYYKIRLALIHSEMETCRVDTEGMNHLLELRGRAREIRRLLNLKARKIYDNQQGE